MEFGRRDTEEIERERERKSSEKRAEGERSEEKEKRAATEKKHSVFTPPVLSRTLVLSLSFLSFFASVISLLLSQIEKRKREKKHTQRGIEKKTEGVEFFFCFFIFPQEFESSEDKASLPLIIFLQFVGF